MPEPTPAPAAPSAIRAAHLAWGWASLAFWVLAGLGLEALHAFKVPWYLDVGMEPRRLMFQLAHAHGALLGGLNVAFALSQPHLAWGPRGPDLASRLLKSATLLLPGGFLLGGVWIRGGDPGYGVLPAPLGGLLLCASMMIVGRAALRRRP
ncbi:MAG: hypothetical protein H6702_09365 [Myxococcales bacterium]|nr:hypothetical protein [Myxococcales bacterium]